MLAAAAAAATTRLERRHRHRHHRRRDAHVARGPEALEGELDELPELVGDRGCPLLEKRGRRQRCRRRRRRRGGGRGRVPVPLPTAAAAAEASPHPRRRPAQRGRGPRHQQQLREGLGDERRQRAVLAAVPELVLPAESAQGDQRGVQARQNEGLGRRAGGGG